MDIEIKDCSKCHDILVMLPGYKMCYRCRAISRESKIRMTEMNCIMNGIVYTPRVKLPKRCDICNLDFKRPSDLIKHNETRQHKLNAGIEPRNVHQLYLHNNKLQQRYQCATCDMCFGTQHALDRHSDTKYHKMKLNAIFD